MATRILFLTIPTLLMTSAAMAAPEREAMLDGETSLSDDELADVRGGFLSAGGAQFDFGASIRTMVNGQVALQTSLQWTDAGAVTQQLAGLGQSIRSQVNNVVASNLAQAGVASPVGNNAGGPGDVTSNAATNVVQEVPAAASVAAAPAEVAAATAASTPSAAATPADPAPSTAGAPAVVTGIEVPGAGGSTQVLANLSPNQIQSIILNSASGQSITQNTDITFTIYNFQVWQQQLAERTVSARLASEMLAASGFAAGH